MAIACLRLVTLRPDPLLSVPRLRRRIALSTVSCAFFPYFAIGPPRSLSTGTCGKKQRLVQQQTHQLGEPSLVTVNHEAHEVWELTKITKRRSNRRLKATLVMQRGSACLHAEHSNA